MFSSSFNGLYQFGTGNGNGSPYASFEVGESYNAMIVAVVPAIQEYNGVSKQGMVPVLAVEDAAGVQCYKASKFISLTGNIYYSKASCAQFYQGLLKTTQDGPALEAEIKDAGLDSFDALCGYPCTVTMSMKTSTTTGKRFANIEKVNGTTSRLKGLEALSEEIGTLDLKKVCGKFLKLDEDHAIILEGARLATTEVIGQPDDCLF